MERKEDATFICCGTDNEKNISDVNSKKKQFEVSLNFQDTGSESGVILKTTSIGETDVIKVSNKPETELYRNFQGQTREEREFKNEEGGYEDDEENNAVEDVESESIFDQRVGEREFKEEKGGYEDDQEDNVEDEEDDDGFTEMDEEGGYKDEDEGEEC